MKATDSINGTETIVQCPAGTFKGHYNSGAIQFLGIRYATSERFGAPVPFKYPEGTHEMSVTCPLPVQVSNELGMLMYGVDLDTLPQEESCQYLSVTVPEGVAEKLPVMVWIHGGSFEAGGCDLPSYDRIPMATECNVIVIAIGYRLGVLGFVRDRDGMLCNNGLLDIITGLRWVKENVQSFGGDPDNITLFGESAGGEAVRSVMLSDGTSDLYKRAIIQSPPLGPMTGRKTMDQKMLEELNRMPIDADIDEVKRVQTYLKSHVPVKGPAKFMKFGPHYGVFPLPEESEIPDRIKLVASDHDIIIGTTEREVSVFIGVSKVIKSLDRFVLTRWIVESIMRNKTESMFRNPSEDFARQYLTSGGKVYLYRFVWMKDYDYIGACHTSDLLLLLGSKGLEGTDISMGKTESQILEEGKPMRKMWAEFARAGEVQETEIKDILTIEKLKL